MALTREGQPRQRVGREARKCLGARVSRRQSQSRSSVTPLTCEHARLVGRLSTALAVAGAAAVGERGGVAGGCDVPAHA